MLQEVAFIMKRLSFFCYNSKSELLKSVFTSSHLFSLYYALIKTI